MGRVCHIDINSAYLSFAAVDALQHGCPIDFRTIPSIVGGNQATRHGIVLTKSIPAKQYNIITGEPVIFAKKKCPNLLVIPVNYPLNMRSHKGFVSLIEEYFDIFEVFSIDELFGDLAPLMLLYPDPLKLAYIIKERIKNELGFTVSIGISENKLLAKMASELKKPDAVSTLYKHEIPDKMWPLPVRELFMVGEKNEAKLNAMGVYTIGDLAHADVKLLKYKLGSWAMAVMLKAYANGIDESPVRSIKELQEIKSVSNGTTIPFDVTNKEEAYMELLSLIETVSMRLRQGNFCGWVVSVSVRSDNLHTYSHQRKLIVPTDCTNVIYREAKRLFDQMWHGEPIRYLGVRVSGLCSNDYIQLSCLEDNERRRLLDKAVDEIRGKHGVGSVYRATFMWSGISPVQGGVIDDFPMMSSIL